MCCPGCQAVALTIISGGLDRFYEQRTDTADAACSVQGPNADETDQWRLLDNPQVQKEFVTCIDDHDYHALLAIDGITCAACIWLLEHHLSKQPGIVKASVNLTTHRASVHWDPQQTSLSLVFAAIAHIGYRAHPYRPDKEEQRLQRETRSALGRLGVAGLGMMQVMMFAAALYAGGSEMKQQYSEFIRWASFVMATPVALYSAWPFYRAALRDLQVRHAGMDIPVSLAILGAYLASAWSTVTHSGHVYFDSVTMFTFFLSAGRFLEMQARHRNGRAGNALLDLLPKTAIRLTRHQQQETVVLDQLQPDDRVLVKPGATIPCDGVIVEGTSNLDESALTGEYLPCLRSKGDPVVGGTVNLEQPLTISVTSTGRSSRVSSIVSMLEQAYAEKPPIVRLADQVAGYFVSLTLITACLVALFWTFQSPEQAFWITLSVLVITCPCALSLATPTALTCATGTLRQQGVLISRGHVLEGLSRASHIVFDKTGTLTTGKLDIKEILPITQLSSQQLMDYVCALESCFDHPIAEAFRQPTDRVVHTPKNHVGRGVEGCINGTNYRFGRPEFAAAHLQKIPSAPDNNGLWLLLCDEEQELGWFHLEDRIRPEAADTIAQLQQAGCRCLLLTGDHSGTAERVAAQLGLDECAAGMSPEQKMIRIRKLNQEGAHTVMIGDGINDAPAMAAAQVSIAVTNATDFAKSKADAILIANDLTRLVTTLKLARKSRRIIAENLTWALAYNLIALPLAACGWIPPYMAAIGMSCSSLLVVGNAMRLSRPPKGMNRTGGLS